MKPCKLSLGDTGALRAVARAFLSKRNLKDAEIVVSNMKDSAKRIGEALLADQVGEQDIETLVDWFRCAAKRDLT